MRTWFRFCVVLAYVVVAVVAGRALDAWYVRRCA